MKLSGKKGTGKTKKKFEEKTKKLQNGTRVPGEWLYMTEKNVTVRDLKEVFDRDDTYGIEIWEEAGVLEIEMPDGNSVDIEAAEIREKDELTLTFAAENQVKTVFLVTFKPEAYEEAKDVMRTIMEKTGGFFCGDTQDFEPRFQ